MAAIHTPYHFVPLSSWVHMPDWAHQVSHDIPFEDGLCGVIRYQLTNRSPLCVGASQSGQPALVSWAKDPLGRPVIPGSSIKGMLRNALQIASFGKFNQVDDTLYSFRDISSARSHYLTNVINPNQVVAGWLKYDELRRTWTFRRCQWAKVRHSHIKEGLNVSIRNADDAVVKYRKLELGRPVYAAISGPKGVRNNRWAEQLSYDTQGVPGHCVFTQKRIVNTKQGAKPDDFEFSYFFHSVEERLTTGVNPQAAQLFSAHESNSLVSYFPDNGHPELGFPVFALEKQGRVHSFGFARMPRVNYQQSTLKMVENSARAHTSDLMFDFAELMFGTLRDEGLSLKSRVAFTDMTAENLTADQLYQSGLMILNSPKPTFTPAYVEQQTKPQGGKNYWDYDDGGARLNGWKRYISKQPETDKLTSATSTDKNKVSSLMELAPVGSEFSGTLVFHNLKPEELGALLWVLSLGGDAEVCHQLGHGKPFGAGAVQITPSLSRVTANDPRLQASSDSDFYLDCFKAHMDEAYGAVSPGSEWLQSPQLTNLLAMGKIDANAGLNTAYMSIDNKEFQHAKRDKQKLEPFAGLSRGERTRPDARVSMAFAAGRLSALFDANDNWQQEQQSSALFFLERKEQELREQQQQAARQEALNNMSPGQAALEQLQVQLMQVSQQERSALLRDAIGQFSDRSLEVQPDEAQALWQLARQHNFHKSNKKVRQQEHKAMLAQLAEVYGFEVPS